MNDALHGGIKGAKTDVAWADTHQLRDRQDGVGDQTRVRIRVPATTANLGPGYDCIGMALELYNYLTLEVPIGAGRGNCSPGLTIEVFGKGADKIDRGPNNLAVVAMKRLFAEAGAVFPASMKVTLENDIPIARGLGSSASAIVAGLMAANVLLENRFKRNYIALLATQIEGHPDNVLPAILGGIVISASGRVEAESPQGENCSDLRVRPTRCEACGPAGEKIPVPESLLEDYLRLEPPSRLKALVFVPDFELSTSEARQALPKSVPLKDAVFNVSRAALLAAAIARDDLSLLKIATRDRLHQPYRARLVPGMEEIIDLAERNECLGAALSGAGPSVLVLIKDDLPDRGVDLLKACLGEPFSKRGIEYEVLELRPDHIGAKRCSEPKVGDRCN
jgi:homoserine kinase